MRGETSAKVKNLQSERDSAAARYHEFLASTPRIVKTREGHKNQAAETLLKQRKVYDECRKVTVEELVAEWGDLRERVEFLTNDLENKSLKLQKIPDWVLDAARLRKKMREARKETKSRGAILAALKEVGVAITLIKKEVSKLLLSATELREYRLEEAAQARQREVEIKSLREREKTLNRTLASVRKSLAGVKVENASLWWARGSADEKVAALEAEVGLAPKVVADLDQLNKTQVAQSVDATFSDH